MSSFINGLYGIEFELGDGISIRRWQLDDAVRIFGVIDRNREHLQEFMEWMRPDYSIKDADEFIERAINVTKEKDHVGFGIFRQGKLLGAIGYSGFDMDAGVTDIGYWLDADEQGKGIVSRACEKLIETAFNDLGMNRIQIRCATANARSAAIPERFGFTKEGVQRQHVARIGTLYDFAIYGLLRDEWKGGIKNK